MNEKPDFIEEMLTLNGDRQKVKTDVIIEAFERAFPSEFYENKNRYEAINAILEDLVKTNKISLPKNKKAKNFHTKPPLPLWIQINLPAPLPSHKPWKNFPWHPELAWVSSIKRISLTSFEELKKLNDFFIQKHNVEIEFMPEKERSLEIFGFEKKLGEMMQREWFNTHISYEKLRCYPTVEPFASKTFCKAGSPRAIIIENRDTFTSFCIANNRFDIPFYRHIIYGAGNRIEKTILWIREFDSNIEKIDYFGDIDYEGFAIPDHLNTILRTNSISPEIKFATPYYEKLVQIGREKFKITGLSKEKTFHLLNFLSLEDQVYLTNLLKENMRIPQEFLGWKEIHQIMSRDSPQTIITN